MATNTVMLYDTKHSTVHIDNDHLKVSLAAMVTPATPCSPVPGTQMVTVQSSQYRTLAITIGASHLLLECWK